MKTQSVFVTGCDGLMAILTWGLEALSKMKKNFKDRRLARRIQRLDAEDELERVKIAAAFNHLYCYGDYYDKTDNRPYDGPNDGVGLFGIHARRGNAWMCPACNKIHLSIGVSSFNGLIWPACCEHPEGPRLDDLIESAFLKRPRSKYAHLRN